MLFIYTEWRFFAANYSSQCEILKIMPRNLNEIRTFMNSAFGFSAWILEQSMGAIGTK